MDQVIDSLQQVLTASALQAALLALIGRATGMRIWDVRRTKRRLREHLKEGELGVLRRVRIYFQQPGSPGYCDELVKDLRDYADAIKEPRYPRVRERLLRMSDILRKLSQFTEAARAERSGQEEPDEPKGQADVRTPEGGVQFVQRVLDGIQRNQQIAEAEVGPDVGTNAWVAARLSKLGEQELDLLAGEVPGMRLRRLWYHEVPLGNIAITESGLRTKLPLGALRRLDLSFFRGKRLRPIRDDRKRERIRAIKETQAKLDAINFQHMVAGAQWNDVYERWEYNLAPSLEAFVAGKAVLPGKDLYHPIEFVDSSAQMRTASRPNDLESRDSTDEARIETAVDFEVHPQSDEDGDPPQA